MLASRQFAVLGSLCVFVGFVLSRGFAASEPNEKWEVQYQWDENQGDLILTDLKFPSAKRGIASGFITRKVNNVILGSYEKEIPLILVTANGGQAWSQVVVKEVPNTLFFLDDSLGWFVSDNGIWSTTESGRKWTQIAKMKEITRVYFLTAKHGYALGNEKRILETEDGGAHWKLLPAAAEPKTTKEWTVYSAMSFADQNNGSIGGWSRPPSRDDYEPAFLHPDSTKAEHTPAQTTVLLRTFDGGKTWKSFTQSFYGEITQLSYAPGGRSLALFEFPKSYPWPSEVFLMTGNSESGKGVYRAQNRAVTSALVAADGTGYIAGYELPGRAHPSAIPGKVKILRSNNLETWTDLPVDYRAVARRVWLASSDPDNIWLATDTGFILKLERP